MEDHMSLHRSLLYPHRSQSLIIINDDDDDDDNTVKYLVSAHPP